MAATQILLVEDDRDLVELLGHVLHAADYTVDLARTVGEAEQWLIQQHYGLVIADWRLPGGSGIAILDRAADLGMGTALLTGYAFHISSDIAARHEVWLKPMRPTELIEGVERRMEKNGA